MKHWFELTPWWADILILLGGFMVGAAFLVVLHEIGSALQEIFVKSKRNASRNDFLEAREQEMTAQRINLLEEVEQLKATNLKLAEELALIKDGSYRGENHPDRGPLS